MKKGIFAGVCLVAIILPFAGCQEQQKVSKATSGSNLLMSIDFEQNVPLTYKFVSERKVSLDLDPSGKYSKSGKASGSAQQISEKLEMDIVYKPVAVDPYGYST